MNKDMMKNRLEKLNPRFSKTDESIIISIFNDVYDSILLEFEEMIPARKGKCDCEYGGCGHSGFNSCRSEILSAIKKLKDE